MLEKFLGNVGRVVVGRRIVKVAKRNCERGRSKQDGKI